MSCIESINHLYNKIDGTWWNLLQYIIELNTYILYLFHYVIYLWLHLTSLALWH